MAAVAMFAIAFMTQGASAAITTPTTNPPRTSAETTTGSTRATTSSVAPPPLSPSDQKLEQADKYAIGIGLAAGATYFLYRRFRRPGDGDGDGVAVRQLDD